MIRRNTPGQVYYLPKLALTADGAAVTTGATLVVAKDGVESASTGTLAHYSGGVWKYEPTQSETDCVAMAFILTATNADPVVLNLITTAANTAAVAFGANTVAPDNATIGNIYTVLQLTDADVATLLTRIVGTLASGTHQPQTGDSFARLGAPAGASIAADIAAIDGGGGLTGPWTRTITVTDSVSGDPIQNATVRFFRTGESESQATNASGVATFTVTANTWSYAIVANGYAGASGTVEVGASGDTAVGLVANPAFSASAPLCAVTLPIKDQYGQPLPATMVTLTFAGVTTGAAPAGVVMSPPPVQTSGPLGIVGPLNLIRLAKYTATYRIGTQARQVSFTVPDAGTFTVSD